MLGTMVNLLGVDTFVCTQLTAQFEKRWITGNTETPPFPGLYKFFENGFKNLLVALVSYHCFHTVVHIFEKKLMVFNQS